MFIAHTLAEAADTAQETLETVELDAPQLFPDTPQKLTLFNWVFFGVAVYMIVTGLLTLFTGKLYGTGKSYDKYTEESLKTAMPGIGLGNALLGVAIALLELVLTGNIAKVLGLILVGVLCAAFIAVMTVTSKKLVEKK